MRTSGETDATLGLSPEQVELDVGYGLVTHRGAGLLTTYDGLATAKAESYG